MLKNINQEIDHLIKLKKEIDEIAILKKTIKNLQVVSKARYDCLANKKLLKPDVLYYIASLEAKDYIEDFEG